jgi:hypothetical protein
VIRRRKPRKPRLTLAEYRLLCELRERYGLNPGDVIARFGALGGPPPGYLVVWCEGDEHYRWVMEGGDVWSDAPRTSGRRDAGPGRTTAPANPHRGGAGSRPG